MKVINVDFQSLKPSMILGGFIYTVPANLGELHYLWIKNNFVPGIITGTASLDIPIVGGIPTLFFLLDMAEKLGVEPTIYRVTSALFSGLGIAFHNCKQEG